MLQVLQNLRTGATVMEDMPVPTVQAGEVRIDSLRSLISPGTERMLVDFGRAGWIDKARQQPEKVREVVDKVRADGVVPTADAVLNKLDQPIALGYCNVGIVECVGSGASRFHPGERVASNGAHAEQVRVAENLCAVVPDNVSDDEAAFTVMGAIALQGIRLADPTLGECFVVMGLGVVGLMTVQLLRANGCRVLGVDPNPDRTTLAREFGAETMDPSSGKDPIRVAEAFSRGRGVDGVFLTLSTDDSRPVSQAACMSRKRGRIVLVGVAGLELNRSEFYEKELSFRVSCSYGPGRYDPEYEQKGHDYPVGFVRWTAQRNFEAVLDLMSSGMLDVRPLITHRFSIEDAPQAYELLSEGRQTCLGILLEYDSSQVSMDRTVRLSATGGPGARNISTRITDVGETGLVPAIGMIGAGNYAGRVLIPALRKAGASLEMIANTGGPRGMHLGRKHGFGRVTTDADELIHDPAVNTVFVATRHDAHAQFVCEALMVGKHVFCEKPLALRTEEIERIQDACEDENRGRLLMVGFNRRFAPHVRRMKLLLGSVSQPKSFLFTVNAGSVPSDHWTQDPGVGGGRIVGEACHFVDLMRHLAGHPLTEARIEAAGRAHSGDGSDDSAQIFLAFSDGSTGCIHYLANGHKSYPKERIEIFCSGRVLKLDNFRRLSGYGWPGFRRMNLWTQDKGQSACVASFLQAIRRGRDAPIPLDEILEVSRVTIELAEAARH